MGLAGVVGVGRAVFAVLMVCTSPAVRPCFEHCRLFCIEPQTGAYCVPGSPVALLRLPPDDIVCAGQAARVFLWLGLRLLFKQPTPAVTLIVHTALCSKPSGALAGW